MERVPDFVDGKVFWAFDNATILFAKMSAATSKVPKLRPRGGNTLIEAPQYGALRRYEAAFGAVSQLTGDGGTETLEYLCSGAKMNR